MNDELKTNMTKLPTRYTTWVVALICSVAYYWLQLTPAEQAKLIDAYPWLSHAAPLSGLLAFLAARVWPQNGKTPPDAQDTQPMSPKE